MHINKNRFTTFLLLVFVLALLPMAMGRAASDKPASAASQAARIERGAYLVKVMGCNDCHTPWKLGPRGPDEEGHVAPGLQQPTPEVAAKSPGPDHEYPHGTLSRRVARAACPHPAGILCRECRSAQDMCGRWGRIGLAGRPPHGRPSAHARVPPATAVAGSALRLLRFPSSFPMHIPVRRSRG